ncbi:MAG: hypothetical protein P1U58_14250 [Verrucomicrobiales bacterium]|nr:hypothetical protein [Verrucomicrobiales bacterium]
MATTIIEDFEGTPSGECPYCKKICWVGSDENSCEHLFATGDYMGGSEPWSMLDVELDETAKCIVSDFVDRDIDEQTAIIKKVGGEAGKTLDALRNRRLWWTEFVESEMIEADIDEAMFSTTYYSAFVPDVEKALGILKPRFLKAAAVVA